MRRPVSNDHFPSLRVRCGYTLLELLIASVLVAALMAATWNLMTMYSGFLVSGRAQATEQQLSRSLLDLLATDLRSVTMGSALPGKSLSPSIASAEDLASPPFRSAIPATAEDGEIASSSDLSSAGTDDLPLPEVALRGDAHELTLLVTQPKLDFQLTRSLPADEWDAWEEQADVAVAATEERSGNQWLPQPPRVPEWIQVLYRFVPPQPTVADEGALPPGLHRFEIPVEYLGLLLRAGAFAADDRSHAQGGLEEEAWDMAAALERLRQQGVTEIQHEWIPEVVGCRWEFLVESSWRSAWDSVQDGALPSAVRLRLKLLSSGEQHELMTALGATDAAEDLSQVETEPAELFADTDVLSDPYKAFHPRTYARIVLLEAVRGPRRAIGSELPGESGSTDASGLMVGGTP